MRPAVVLYDTLLFLHILAAMVWVGGAVLLGVLARSVLSSGQPEEVERFLATLRFVGPRVLAPATIGVAALGIWMVLNSAAWDFGQTWVQLALVLLGTAFVIGAAYQSRAAITAQRAAHRGDHEEARRRLQHWAWGYLTIVLLLIAATWDMVTKPGL
jgi:uncharacterized membrane protein